MLSGARKGVSRGPDISCISGCDLHILSFQKEKGSYVMTCMDIDRDRPKIIGIALG